MEDENIKILKDYQAACDAIREAAKCGEKISHQAESTEMEQQVAEMVELIHQAGKSDCEAGARKLLNILNKKQTHLRIGRLLWMTGSVAAAVVLFVTWQIFFGLKEAPSIPYTTVKLAEITVPTILYTEENDSIVSFKSLDLKQESARPEKKNQSRAVVESLSAEEQQKIRYNRIIIPQGFTYKITLADGSAVTLNAGSELKYPVAFQDSLREVELKGEAFFEIAKSEIPFVVKGGATRVKVYGTRFNFLYSEELELSEAVLLEGCIGMNVGSKELKISPNEQIYHKPGEDVFHVKKVNAADYIGWMGPSFKYNEISLDRIVFDISRWYGVKISLAPELKNEIYTLEIDKASGLEWVMQALGLITERKVKKEGGEYSIY